MDINFPQGIMGLSARLEFWFVGNGQVELHTTTFAHSSLPAPLRSVRGKTSGAYETQGTFQWTPAVRALALFVVKCASRKFQNPEIEAPVLIGLGGSAASSLDYAISKQPNWLLDIFGVDGSGLGFVRRLIKRTNPERKREGPVALSLNSSFLATNAISIYLNGSEVRDEVQMRGVEQSLELWWKQDEQRLVGNSQEAIVQTETPHPIQGHSVLSALRKAPLSVVPEAPLPAHPGTQKYKIDPAMLAKIPALELQPFRFIPFTVGLAPNINLFDELERHIKSERIFRNQHWYEFSFSGTRMRAFRDGIIICLYEDHAFDGDVIEFALDRRRAHLGILSGNHPVNRIINGLLSKLPDQTQGAAKNGSNAQAPLSGNKPWLSYVMSVHLLEYADPEVEPILPLLSDINASGIDDGNSTIPDHELEALARESLASGLEVATDDIAHCEFSPGIQVLASWANVIACGRPGGLTRLRHTLLEIEFELQHIWYLAGTISSQPLVQLFKWDAKRVEELFLQILELQQSLRSINPIESSAFHHLRSALTRTSRVEEVLKSALVKLRRVRRENRILSMM